MISCCEYFLDLELEEQLKQIPDFESISFGKSLLYFHPKDNDCLTFEFDRCKKKFTKIILFIEKEISFDIKEMSIEQVLNSNLLKKDAINALFYHIDLFERDEYYIWRSIEPKYKYETLQHFKQSVLSRISGRNIY